MTYTDTTLPPVLNVSADGERFIDKNYQDTLEQLHSAYSYFNTQGRKDLCGYTPEDRLRYNFAMSIITLRLTNVMAWLLTTKAVFAGEITSEEASRKVNRLSYHDLCSGEERDEASAILLPPAVSQMLLSTQALYRRIQRLDEQYYGMPEQRH